MLCLLAAESNDISGLGPVAAIGIGVGLIAMITLLPALLVVFGRWIFWPVKPGYGSPEPTTRGLWSRVGQGISRRPRAVALGVLLDTIVVRSVLVTALTLDIGRHVWWPSALARPGQRQQSALANPESRSVTGGT